MAWAVNSSALSELLVLERNMSIVKGESMSIQTMATFSSMSPAEENTSSQATQSLYTC